MNWMFKYINEIDAALGSGDPSNEELEALQQRLPIWHKDIESILEWRRKNPIEEDDD